MKNSNYYLRLRDGYAASEKQIKEDIKNYTDLKESAVYCTSQMESIVKTYKKVGSCLEYVCPVGRPYDNGECLKKAEKLQEIINQLNLLINECTSKLSILKSTLESTHNNYLKYNSLYNQALENEKKSNTTTNNNSSANGTNKTSNSSNQENPSNSSNKGKPSNSGRINNRTIDTMI